MKIFLLVLAVSLAGNTLLAAGLDFEDLRRIESDGVKSWSLHGVAEAASAQIKRYAEIDAAKAKDAVADKGELAKGSVADDTRKTVGDSESSGVKIIHLSE